MNNAEYLKMLRAKAKAEGKCSVCRARQAREGRMTCQECVDRARDFRSRTYGVKCDRCYGDLGERIGMAYCGACAEHYSEVESMRRHIRKSNGMCAECGKAALSTDSMCDRCADMLRDNAMMRARLAGAKPYKCSICEILGHNRSGHARMMERAKEWAP